MVGQVCPGQVLLDYTISRSYKDLFMILVVFLVCLIYPCIIKMADTCQAVCWMLGVFEAGQYPGTAYYLCWLVYQNPESLIQWEDKTKKCP